MKEKALIILHSFNIRKFDTKRYELKYLKKNIHVEFHHFHNYLHPNLINAFKNHILKKKYVHSFDTLSEWKEYIISLRKKYPNLFIFNMLTQDQYKELLILYLIKKFKIKRIDISDPGILENENLGFSLNLLRKFKKLLSLFHLKLYFVQKKKVIFNFFQKLLNLNADFILVIGRKNFLPIKKRFNNNKNIIIKKFNSFDKSRFLLNKNSKRIIKENYCVFLGTPDFLLGDYRYFDLKIDNSIYNRNVMLLNNFFSDFERLNKTKIVIACHPKATAQLDLKRFGNRASFYNKTNELVKYCKATISSVTLSISYPLLHKKPHFFIYFNNFIDPLGVVLMEKLYLHKLNKLISSTSINVENYNKNEVILKKKKINLVKYNKYIKTYISDLNITEPNYKIILDIIKKN